MSPKLPVSPWSDVAGGAVAREEITDPTQTEPKADGQLAYRAFMVLIGWHYPNT
jgi:hypothetical protein